MRGRHRSGRPAVAALEVTAAGMVAQTRSSRLLEPTLKPGTTRRARPPVSAMRRVQVAFFGSVLGDYMFATAVIIWAFTLGSAGLVGVFLAVRYVVIAVAGPIGAVIADRYDRRRVMVTLDLTRAGLLVGAGACLTLERSPYLLLIFAVLVATIGAPFRSAQAGLMPSLTSSAKELIHSNALISNIEIVVTFLGAAAAGAVVGVLGTAPVVWFACATYLLSALGISTIRRQPPASGRGTRSGPTVATSFQHEAVAGFAVLWRDRDLRHVAALVGGAGMCWGVVSALLVVLTVEVFHAAPSAMGYLDACIGAGSVIGGLILLRRVETLSVGRGLALGALGWGVPMVAMGLLDQPVVIIVALVVIGLADPLAMLGAEIIPQRIADDAVLSRVHAALRATQIGLTALGSLVAPLCLVGLGLSGTLLIVGALVTVGAAWSARAMPRLDARFAEPPEAALLRAVPVFASMTPVSLAALARRVDYVNAATGEAVVRQGEPGNLFYVVVQGEVEVTQGLRFLRRQTAGDFFGEIALLHDIPRSATVKATLPTRLLTVSRSDFLSAVAGHLESRTIIEDVAARRRAF